MMIRLSDLVGGEYGDPSTYVRQIAIVSTLLKVKPDEIVISTSDDEHWIQIETLGWAIENQDKIIGNYKRHHVGEFRFVSYNAEGGLSVIFLSETDYHNVVDTKIT